MSLAALLSGATASASSVALAVDRSLPAAGPWLETWPIALRDWLVQFLPALVRGPVEVLLNLAAILTVFGLGFAFTTLAERKLIGRFQNRPGPNRTGPFGLLQPFADAIKALTKEDVVPATADKVLHFLAPVIILTCVLLTYAVLPFGRYLVPVDLDAAVLYFFAAGVTGELAVFMAGWSSHNKYALFAAMRALAQLISYELPLLLAAVPVIMLTGTLSTQKIVLAQGGWTFGFIPHWHVLTPWGFAGFIIFMISALAESNRSPFDLPEAESELIAGHLTEYSGFKYALFFMGEYFGLFALSGLGITLFLGGWQAPLPFLQFIPSYVWFGLKLVTLIVVFVWIRATFLRLRIDQLTRFSWKFLTPLALVNLGTAAWWHLAAGFSPALQLVRWAVALAFVIVPFVLIGRRLSAGLGPRAYRYA